MTRGAEKKPLPRGTIVAVHNLRNTFFLPKYGLNDIPLMISVVDLTTRPNLRRAIGQEGIKAFLGVSSPVMIDSGGFSFMTGRYAPITVDELVAIYRTLGADVYAALDVPPAAGDDASQRRRKWQRTLANLDRMLELGGTDQLMPVVHGRTLGEIIAACEDVRRRIKNPSIVALGGMVPFLRGHMSEQRFQYRRADGSKAAGEVFVADAIVACRSQFPRSHFHVLGVGSTTTAIAVLALGADSIDSLAWRRAAGFGTILLAGLAERIISLQSRSRYSRPKLAKKDKILLHNCKCPICLTHSRVSDRIRVLAKSYIARAVHNVWTLRTEENAFRDAVAAGTVIEFSTSRVHGRHRFARVVREHLELSYSTPRPSPGVVVATSLKD
jgi:queuine/archaeosine tRNA-ribosyltransferase